MQVSFQSPVITTGLFSCFACLFPSIAEAARRKLRLARHRDPPPTLGKVNAKKGIRGEREAKAP